MTPVTAERRKLPQRRRSVTFSFECATAAVLTAGIEELFADKPEAEWREHIERIADRLLDRLAADMSE
jgi:hypothetical protein